MKRIEIMKDAARQAGAYMRGSHERASTEKSNSKDFVTVSDIKSQNILRQTLQAAYPDAIILSEEDDEAARQALISSDFSGYVLDPIESLIVREAGGKALTLRGEDAPFTTADVIIGVPSLVEQLAVIFAKNPELQQ
jgi:fructose-1,6-bisphosphatase/inositol monophosphatase family enzyme